MGKDTKTTTKQTSGLDPASQAFVDRTRTGAQGASDVALNNPGQFFLGPDQRSVQDIIQPFMDPFQSQVIDANRAEFDHLRGLAVGGAGGTNQAATNAGAFGGSRHGVAQGVRLGELDRAQTSQNAGLLSQNFQQAIQAGIPFAERQRALAQQQAQEPLFRQQQSQQFLNLGLGPTGSVGKTTNIQKGNLGRDIAGLGLLGAGAFTGNPGTVAAGGSALTSPGFAGGAGVIPPSLFQGQNLQDFGQFRR